MRHFRLVNLLGWMLFLCWPCFAQSQVGPTPLWLYNPISWANTVAISPDGSKVAVGGYAAVQVFNAKTGSLIYCIPTRFDWATAAFSPDGTTLAVAGTLPFVDSTRSFLNLYSLATGKVIKSFDATINDPASMAFSSDGKMIIEAGDTSSQFPPADLWNVVTGKLIAHINTNAAVVRAACFSPDNKYIGLGGWRANGVAEVWNVSTQKLVRSFDTGSTGVGGISFSRDGTSVAIGCQVSPSGPYLTNGAVQIWSLASGKMTNTQLTGQGWINSVQYSPNGKVLAAGVSNFGFAGQLDLWDTATGKLIANLNHATQEEVTGISFSQDSKYLIESGTSKDYPNPNIAKLWNVGTGKIATTFNTNYFTTNNSAAYSKDGSTIANGGASLTGSSNVATGWIGFWDAATGNLTRSISAAGEVKMVAYSLDGKKLADCGGNNNGAVLELRNSATGSTLINLSSDKNRIYWALAFSPDGKLLAASSTSVDKSVGFLELWDAGSGKLIKQLSSAQNVSLDTLCFSPDGKTLAVGGENGSQQGITFTGVMELWSVQDQTRIATLYPNEYWIHSVQFSPDGSQLAIAGVSWNGSNYGSVELWNVASLSRQANLALPSDSGTANSVCYSPDGRILYIADQHGTQALSGLDQTLIGTFGLTSTMSIAVSPDGRFISYVSFQSGSPNIGVMQGPLKSIQLASKSIKGGTSLTGTVYLDQVAPTGGATINLVSNNAAASVPTTIFVPAGHASATFKITTKATSTTQSALVTASAGGFDVGATLLINR